MFDSQVKSKTSNHKSQLSHKEMDKYAVGERPALNMLYCMHGF